MAINDPVYVMQILNVLLLYVHVLGWVFGSVHRCVQWQSRVDTLVMQKPADCFNRISNCSTRLRVY